MKNKLIAVCLIFCLHTSQAQNRQGEAPLQVSPAVTRVLIDSIRQSMYRNYIFPDTAGKMTAYLEEEYKKGAYKDITDPLQLADRLQQDLQKVHHDGHFNLRYAPPFARELSDTTRMAERGRSMDSMALVNQKAGNFGFHKVEIVSGNIGYLQFHGFSGFIREARPTITAAFRFLSNTRALIIDLRENGGGSPVMVSQIESYLFPEKTHLNDIIDRSQNRKIEFWTDPEKAEGLTLRMPVYILTSRRTFSGAEDFTYGLQSVKRATIIGDTTGGGAHPVRPFPVGQGFVASIPFARSLNPYTHTDWEGTGVIPDIPVPAGKALEKAEEVIFTDLVANATTDEEKRKVQWQLNDLIARRSAPTVDSAAVAPYTGRYQGGLVFYVDRSVLYCKNAERGNDVFKLSPISASKFQLDENVQVEFTKDDKGNASGINMWWSDGRMTYKPKIK